MARHEESALERRLIDCALQPNIPYAEDTVDRYEDIEYEFISDPIMLRRSAGAIIQKFGQPRQHNGEPSICTPDTKILVPTYSVSNPIKEITVHLSTPHIGSEEYVIYQSAVNVDPSVRLPMFTIAGDDIEMMICNQKHQELFDTEDYIFLHLVLKQINDECSKQAEIDANTMNVKYPINEKNKNVNPSHYVFYISKKEHKYVPIKVDFNYPSEALKEAVQQFFENTNTSAEEYGGKHPFRLNGFCVEVAGECFTQRIDNLQAYFRDLTVIDMHTLLKMYRQTALFEYTHN